MFAVFELDQNDGRCTSVPVFQSNAGSDVLCYSVDQIQRSRKERGVQLAVLQAAGDSGHAAR